MNIGDIVTVKPAEASLYLIVGEDSEKENNWPDHSGDVLGRMFELYNPLDGDIKLMHEKWIRVIDNE